jgi:hypothetical protein
VDLAAVPDFTSTWLGGYLGPVGKEPEIRITIY